MIDDLIGRNEPQEYADDESMKASLDRASEKHAGLQSALDAVASPCLILVLEPDGVLCLENITEDGDIEDLKTIGGAAIEMIYAEVLEKQGKDAAERWLFGIQEADD